MAAMVRLTERMLDRLTVVVFLAMFGLVVMQVTMRYVFNDPIVWSDELAQYAFVWLAFLGVLRATRNRSHVAIDALTKRLPARITLALALVWQGVALAFALVLAWYGYALAGQNFTVRMTSIDLPYWPVYAIVPLAGLGLAAYALRDARALVRRSVSGGDGQ